MTQQPNENDSEHHHKPLPELLKGLTAEPMIQFHNGRVTLPRWMVSMAWHLVILMAIGAACTIVVVAVALTYLTAATDSLRQNQVDNRAILESGQKTILNEIGGVKKAVVQKAKKAKADDDQE